MIDVVKKFKKRGLESARIQRIPSFDIDDFLERIDLLKKFCDLIKIQEKEYQILMKNQLLVSLVSTIEYNLKSFISYLIDEMDIDPKDSLNEDSIEINLDVLKQMESSNLTKGRIISAHLDYFNAGKVYSIMNKILYSFSEQELVDCSSGPTYGNHACNGGLMDNAFQYTIDNGLCKEDEYPYTAEKGSCDSSRCTPTVKINKCYDVPPNNELALKEAISFQPVSVAIEADTKYFQSYKSGVLTGDSCGTTLDHGVLVVGYGTENGQDYWLVKNSWSASWGDEGYIKIGRSDSTNSPGVCGIAMQPSYPSF